MSRGDLILDDLEQHRRWIATEGREGAMASWPGEIIDGVDLTGAMLAGALLVETTFVRCPIVAAEFSRAVAGGASFVGASAAGARFVKAQLESAVFDGSDLRAATFLKADLGGASLKGCWLAGATFDDARCVGANFAGAQLRAASLVRTDFSGGDLAGADLADAHLVETRFDQETRLDGVVGLERCVVESILVGPRRLEQDAGTAWLRAQATRPAWSVADLETWLVSKMSGRVEVLLATLGVDEARMREVAAELGHVFDAPGHAAAEYRRVLGRPLERAMVGAAVVDSAAGIDATVAAGGPAGTCPALAPCASPGSRSVASTAPTGTFSPGMTRSSSTTPSCQISTSTAAFEVSTIATTWPR